MPALGPDISARTQDKSTCASIKPPFPCCASEELKSVVDRPDVCLSARDFLDVDHLWTYLQAEIAPFGQAPPVIVVITPLGSDLGVRRIKVEGPYLAKETQRVLFIPGSVQQRG
jgi:hypothetical protein